MSNFKYSESYKTFLRETHNERMEQRKIIMEKQLKKYRQEIADELMDFISKFEIKDVEYLYLELRYLSKVIDNYKD